MAPEVPGKDRQAFLGGGPAGEEIRPASDWFTGRLGGLEPATRPLWAAEYRTGSLILLSFRLNSIAFVALWLGRFWCETGAVTPRFGPELREGVCGDL